MQSASFRIWTRVAVSISYDDNHYTMGTSLNLSGNNAWKPLYLGLAVRGLPRNCYISLNLIPTFHNNRNVKTNILLWNKTSEEKLIQGSNIRICLLCIYMYGGVMVSKLDKQTYTSEFESHWVPHSFGLVPHRSKELRKLLYICVSVRNTYSLAEW